MAKLWDISQRLRPAIPVWPGEPDFAIRQIAVIGSGCPVNVSVMTMPVHAGTHADSPLHYHVGGVSSADSALDPYIGPCHVLDVRHARDRVEMADLDWDAIEGESRILLRTFEHFPATAWVADFVAIAPDVIRRFGQAGVRLIGTDAPSIDPQESKTLDAHHAVLDADMRILEGLVLDAVPPGRYELIALPLKIEGSDASPVRAVLRELAA